MCFQENGFSQKLAEELKRQISLKPEIGNFFFIVAPKKQQQNRTIVVQALSLTASLLERDYNLFKNGSPLSEDPFSTDCISAEYAANFLITLSEEFIKVFGLRKIKDRSEIGSILINFLILESITRYFITILNEMPSPKLDLSHVYNRICEVTESANKLTI